MPVSSSISCPQRLRFDKQLILSWEEETMDYPAGSAAHQTTLSLFGQQPNLDEKLAESTEAFIRDLYPKTRRQTSTMDALRYVMFCQQRKRKNEALPPTSDSLRQHMKRANY